MEEKCRGVSEHHIWQLVDVFSASVLNKIIFGSIFRRVKFYLFSFFVCPLNLVAFKDNLMEYYRFKTLTGRIETFLSHPFTSLLSTSIWLRHFPPFSSKFWQLNDAYSQAIQHCEELIEQRQKLRQMTNESNEKRYKDNDFIDIFLSEMDQVGAQMTNGTDSSASDAREHPIFKLNIINKLNKKRKKLILTVSFLTIRFISECKNREKFHSHRICYTHLTVIRFRRYIFSRFSSLFTHLIKKKDEKKPKYYLHYYKQLKSKLKRGKGLPKLLRKNV